MKFKITPQSRISGSDANFIDLARFIGIACVIYGHCHPFYREFESALREVICCFHMPLFFMISGFLDKQETSINLKKYRKIFYSLAIPYLIYNIPYLPIAFSHPASFALQLLTASVPPNDPTWFFFALLWVKIITTTLRKYEIELFFISIVTYIVLQFIGAKLGTFFCCHAILTGIIFFYLGKLYHLIFESQYMYVSILLGLLLVSYSIMNFGRYDMYWGFVGNPLLYLLTASVSSIALLTLCKYMEHRIGANFLNRVIKPISRGTMIIVGTHYIFAHFANKMLFTTYGGFGIKLLYVIVLLLGYWVIIKRTYYSFPILYGKTHHR